MMQMCRDNQKETQNCYYYKKTNTKASQKDAKQPQRHKTAMACKMTADIKQLQRDAK